MPGKKRIIFIAGSLIITIVLVVLMKLGQNKPENPLPIYGNLTEFKLTNSLGSPFNSNELKGKIWVANFIFTSCPGICPRLTSQMAKLQKRFLENDSLHFVSISVDPETDTPQRLKEYANKYGANFSKWHFLTGEKESIKNIMSNGFKLGFDNEPVFHSDYFVLIDSASQIRGYYSFTNEEVFKNLPRDIKRLLQTSQAIVSK